MFDFPFLMPGPPYSLGLIPQHIDRYGKRKSLLHSTYDPTQKARLEAIQKEATQIIANYDTDFNPKEAQETCAITLDENTVGSAKQLEMHIKEEIKSNQQGDKDYLDILNILLLDVQMSILLINGLGKPTEMKDIAQTLAAHFGGVCIHFQPQAFHPLEPIYGNGLRGGCFGFTDVWPKSNQSFTQVLEKQSQHSGFVSSVLDLQVTLSLLQNTLEKFNFKQNATYRLRIANKEIGHVLGIRKCNGISEYEVYDPNFGIFRFQTQKEAVRFLHFLTAYIYRFNLFDFEIKQKSEGYFENDKPATFPLVNENNNKKMFEFIRRNINERLLSTWDINNVFNRKMLPNDIIKIIINDLTQLYANNECHLIIHFLNRLNNSYTPQEESHCIAIIQILSFAFILDKDIKSIDLQHDLATLYHTLIEEFITNQAVRTAFSADNKTIGEITYAYQLVMKSSVTMTDDVLIAFLSLIKDAKKEDIDLVFSHTEFKDLIALFASKKISQSQINGLSTIERKKFIQSFFNNTPLPQLPWPVEHQTLINNLNPSPEISKDIDKLLDHMDLGDEGVSKQIINKLVEPEIIQHLTNTQIERLFALLPSSYLYELRQKSPPSWTDYLSTGFSRWSEIVGLLKIQIFNNIEKGSDPPSLAIREILATSRGYSIPYVKQTTAMQLLEKQDIKSYLKNLH